MKNKSYFKGFIFLLFLLFAGTAFSQNVGISSSSSFTPDASAALDISYTNKGLLIPRVALTANNVSGPIASPATSLLVYNTATAGTSPNIVVPGYYYWNGSVWVMLSTSAQATGFWSTTGNSGTSYPTNYLGTTDNFGLHFKTNAAHRFWIDSLGSVAVGNNPIFSSTREKFLVDAGTTSSFNVINGKGNINSYLQLNIQNTNAGTAASSDVVATADNGNENINYVDMGTNSSANTANLFGGANDSYLYSTGGSSSSTAGGNLYIGTSTASKNLGFLTGGGTIGTAASGSTAAAANNERLHIDGTTGFVGLNNPSPTQVLDITGNMRLSGAFMPNNDPGTTGYFLQSSGSGASPIWYNANNLITTQAWGLTGNTGTTAGTNFIGTTDAVDFVAKTSNAERLRINSAGDVSIGGTALNSSNPEQLLVDAGTTSSTNVISGKGSINSFLQLNIQNLSTGTGASTDVVATADNGTDAANYVDMGINGSNNKNTFYYGVANDAYLYNVGGSTGGNFYIGTSTSGKSLAFLTGGTAASNERMRINGSGYVGIGTTNPRYPLEIATKIAYTTGTYSAYNNNTDGWSTNDGFSYYANGNTSSTANASTGGSGTYYSIVTAGRIAAKEFNAYSDKREKIVIGQSDGKADIALLNKLKITDYTWIDKIGKSPVPEKKLIAQELRAVYPQAVKLIPGFIPDVYQKPVSIQFDQAKKSMVLNFLKAHNSSKGDLLRIYVFDKLYELTVTDIPTSSTLAVNISDMLDLTPAPKDIFVFGKKVNDYHTVDYDAVSMLNVSATQELYRQLEQQKEESKKTVDDLKKQLEDQNQRIKRLEEKLK